MGSIDAACIAGFLCRLCSEMHRTVIHIYSDQGQKHGLAGKINAYLPVTISPQDPLPKTICKTCMKRVEQHHELMVKIQKHKAVFSAQSSRLNRTGTSTEQPQRDQRLTRSQAQHQQNSTESNSDEAAESSETTNSSNDGINNSNSSDVDNNVNTNHIGDTNAESNSDIEISDGSSSSSGSSTNTSSNPTKPREQGIRP